MYLERSAKYRSTSRRVIGTGSRQRDDETTGGETVEMKRITVKGIFLLVSGMLLVMACGDGPMGSGSQRKFTLESHLIETALPSYVNIMFQVTDRYGRGVDYLSTEDFEVREDAEAVSPTESAMQIRKRDIIPYRLRTVLVLDNSLSVGDNLGDIKEAAITLVENIASQQTIAVYEFSEQPVLLQDFTEDVAALRRAITGIELGYPSTNLYGAVREGVSQWTDVFTTTEVLQGFMILLTDGSDTQGSSTMSQALSARGERQVYTIGLGNEIDPTVLQSLGNAGFFQLGDVSQLAAQFREIQEDIARRANSFYWLNYMSPKRGSASHVLDLAVKDNTSFSMITGYFSSAGFYSVRRGVAVNPTPHAAEGVAAVRVAVGGTTSLSAVTYLGSSPPEYRWRSEDESVAEVLANEADPSTAQVVGVGGSGETTAVVVEDVANGLERRVSIEVFSPPPATFALVNGATMDYVWIEPGTFVMGSPESEEGRLADEGPQHLVTITRGFWLGKYELTQAQWEAVMGTRPWSGRDNVQVHSQHPAAYISWNDVQEFVYVLNGAAGEVLYRLPTEAEWEYACRAGTSTPWSAGDDVAQLGDYAWYRDNARDIEEDYAHQVGTKLANPWGLFDMHGNVEELCQDWYGEGYYGEVQTDPRGPATGDYRVVRGYHYNFSALPTRSASRNWRGPSGRSARLGARLVRTR